jgi:hypothetical protein
LWNNLELFNGFDPTSYLISLFLLQLFAMKNLSRVYFCENKLFICPIDIWKHLTPMHFTNWWVFAFERSTTTSNFLTNAKRNNHFLFKYRTCVLPERDRVCVLVLNNLNIIFFPYYLIIFNWWVSTRGESFAKWFLLSMLFFFR